MPPQNCLLYVSNTWGVGQHTTAIRVLLLVVVLGEAGLTTFIIAFVAPVLVLTARFAVFYHRGGRASTVIATMESIRTRHVVSAETAIIVVIGGGVGGRHDIQLLGIKCDVIYV